MRYIDNIPVYKQPISLKGYSYVDYSHGKLFVRGIDNNNQRVTFYCDYKPLVWVPLDFNYTKYNNDIEDVVFNTWHNMIDDTPLVGLRFTSIYSCNRFVRENTTFNIEDGKRVGDTRIHTSPSNMYVSQYITENFLDEIKLTSKDLRIITYDIETEVGHHDYDVNTPIKIKNINSSKIIETTIGDYEDLYNDGNYQINQYDQWVDYNDSIYRFKGQFPSPTQASEKITLITVKDINHDVIDTWGYDDFKSTRDDIRYHKCVDETDLLTQFVNFIESDYPDAISGWNTSQFDNTYVATRIKNVLGEEMMNRLSPEHHITFKQVEFNEFGKSTVETSWDGIADLDYLRLYKKFTYGGRESYKLDAIAELEIGIQKLHNPMGGNFKEFYSGKYDIRNTPKQDDNEFIKLGYQRTQLRKQAREDTNYYKQFKQLDEQIVNKSKQLFIEYNIRDVELVDKIDKKQRFFDLIMTIGYLSCCNFENVFSPVQTWDYKIYNTLYKRNKVIPIKRHGLKAEKFPGAYVKKPLVGKHNFCESFDLDSLNK